MPPINTVTVTNTFDYWRLAFNATAARWNDLGTYDAIIITGGSINGTTIGNLVPAAGTFTNLVVTGTINLSAATITLSDNQISGDKISGGTITVNYCELSNTPVNNNHAASKQYVDTKFLEDSGDGLRYAMIFA
jgi:hypothetical protein